jgi:hypothetical protein
MAVPGHDDGGDPLVTENGAALSPERAAAVAEIRAQAEASEALSFPAAFESSQTARLAEREEPRTVGDVQAIEAELQLIAERRAAASDPAEVAALEARALELRRLAASQQSGAMRR